MRSLCMGRLDTNIHVPPQKKEKNWGKFHLTTQQPMYLSLKMRHRVRSVTPASTSIRTYYVERQLQSLGAVRTVGYFNWLGSGLWWEPGGAERYFAPTLWWRGGSILDLVGQGFLSLSLWVLCFNCELNVKMQSWYPEVLKADSRGRRIRIATCHSLLTLIRFKINTLGTSINILTDLDVVLYLYWKLRLPYPAVRAGDFSMVRVE